MDNIQLEDNEAEGDAYIMRVEDFKDVTFNTPIIKNNKFVKGSSIDMRGSGKLNMKNVEFTLNSFIRFNKRFC